MSASHRYKLPEPRPHESGQTSAGMAILIGVVIACAGLTAIYVFVLGSIAAAVMP